MLRIRIVRLSCVPTLTVGHMTAEQYDSRKTDCQMSIQAMSWVIDHSQHNGNTFVVLLMIANHAKSDGTGAWPSVGTLCRESRLSRRTVQRCINRLSRKWKFDPELHVRIAKGPYGANLYDIPGVKMTQGGRQSGAGGAPISDAGGASRVTPNPSLTVHKDKHGNFYLLGPEGIRTIIGPAEAERYGAKP